MVGALPAAEEATAAAAQRPAEAAGETAAGEVEDAAALEEELPLSRKEQVEAGQVDLLLVNLDLREVGVDGEVGGQVLRDAVLTSRPPFPSPALRVGGEAARLVLTPPIRTA